MLQAKEGKEKELDRCEFLPRRRLSSRARHSRSRWPIFKVLPLGIFASEEEKARDTMERWPGFELINLSWSMGDDTKVEELTSAQLAVSLSWASGPLT